MNKRDAIIKLTQDICGGYAAILFAESSYIGLMFLLATFWFPNIGGAGLIAVLMAVAIAQCLKFRNLNSGLHIYNSLSLGAHYKLDTHLLLLLFLASLLTVFFSVIFSERLWLTERLPAICGCSLYCRVCRPSLWSTGALFFPDSQL